MTLRLAFDFPAFRLFGAALAVAASDPPHGAFGTVPVLLLAFAGFGLWAAAPVVGRPVLTSYRWYSQLSRHRNTVFASACVLVAALATPPVWLMAADCALLLGYLLALDALTGGPIGLRQLRLGWPGGLAAAGTAVVLALTRLAPAHPGSTLAASGRWIAAAGTALAGLALALAVLPPRPRTAQPPTATADRSTGGR